MVVTPLKTTQDTQTCYLVNDAGEFWFVSRIIAKDHKDYETMIFPADKNGEVVDWTEVYEAKGWESMEETFRNHFDLTEQDLMILDLDDGDEIV